MFMTRADGVSVGHAWYEYLGGRSRETGDGGAFPPAGTICTETRSEYRDAGARRTCLFTSSQRRTHLSLFLTFRRTHPATILSLGA